MNYRFRFGCLRDAARLAALHYGCRTELVDSFMCALGEGFLRSYYRAVLESPVGYVICMVDEHNAVQGYTVSAFDAKAHFQSIRRHNLRMLLGSMPAILLRPHLLKGVLLRRKLMAARNDSPSFICMEGARNEFMVVDVAARSGPHAMILMRRTLEVSKAMGVGELWIEVDEENQRALQFHLRLGAEPIRQVARPDGKKRNVMLYRIKGTKSIS